MQGRYFEGATVDRLPSLRTRAEKTSRSISAVELSRARIPDARTARMRKTAIGVHWGHDLPGPSPTRGGGFTNFTKNSPGVNACAEANRLEGDSASAFLPDTNRRPSPRKERRIGFGRLVGNMTSRQTAPHCSRPKRGGAAAGAEGHARTCPRPSEGLGPGATNAYLITLIAYDPRSRSCQHGRTPQHCGRPTLTFSSPGKIFQRRARPHERAAARLFADAPHNRRTRDPSAPAKATRRVTIAPSSSWTSKTGRSNWRCPRPRGPVAEPVKVWYNPAPSPGHRYLPHKPATGRGPD